MKKNILSIVASVVIVVVAAFNIYVDQINANSNTSLFDIEIQTAVANEVEGGSAVVICGTIAIQDDEGNSYTVPYKECSGYGTLPCEC